MVINKKINTKTTILITTKDRPFCLFRLLKFLDNFSEVFNVIVLDSSIKKYKKNQMYLKNGTEVKYYYYKSNILFSNKIFLGLKKVKTKYSVLCAVDDFILPSKFNLFRNFLEKNPKYITVAGSAFHHPFQFHTKLSNFYFEEIYKKRFSNEDDMPKKRIKNYFYGKTRDIFYGYYNTYNLLRFYNFIKKIDDECAEYAANIIPLYFGKAKYIKSFFFSREPNEPFYKQYNNIELKTISKFLKKFKEINSDPKLISLIKNGLLSRKKKIINNKSQFLKYFIFTLKKEIQTFLAKLFKYQAKSNRFKIIIDSKRLKITGDDRLYMKKINELIIKNSQEIANEVGISRKKYFFN
jgi:hypothetical protein